MLPPGRVRQVPALAGQFVRQVPGMAVVKERLPVGTSPVQLPHIVQCSDRKPQHFGSGCGGFSRTAQGRGIDFLNPFIPEPFSSRGRLQAALRGQAVQGVIRFPVTDKNDSHGFCASFCEPRNPGRRITG